MLDRDIRDLAVVALEDRNQGLVAAIDVVTELKLAIVVDERGLIGQVDRNEGRKRDIGLIVAGDHVLDLVERVAVTGAHQRKQHFGIALRILHAHAAVTERPLVIGEQVFIRRVVLIDQEFVGEIEANAAERVLIARRLPDADAAIRIVVEL